MHSVGVPPLPVEDEDEELDTPLLLDEEEASDEEELEELELLLELLELLLLLLELLDEDDELDELLDGKSQQPHSPLGPCRLAIAIRGYQNKGLGWHNIDHKLLDTSQNHQHLSLQTH